MKRPVDKSCQLLSARVIRRQLRQLRAQFDGIRAGEDVEFVHRARVASRRLRTALAMSEDWFGKRRVKRWRKAIRKLTRRLGAARDLDVQIDFAAGFLGQLTDKAAVPGAAYVLVDLDQRRQSVQPEVLRAIAVLQESGALDEIAGEIKGVVPELASRGVTEQGPPVFQKGEKQVRRRMGQLLAYRDSLARPGDCREHHAMRIAAKHLRYTMEVFARAYAGAVDPEIAVAKQLQTLLGEVHDCDVWVAWLDQVLGGKAAHGPCPYWPPGVLARARRGLEHLRQERRQRRLAVFSEVVAYWEEAERGRVWDRLAAALRAHLEWRTPPSESEPATAATEAAPSPVAAPAAADSGNGHSRLGPAVPTSDHGAPPVPPQGAAG